MAAPLISNRIELVAFQPTSEFGDFPCNNVYFLNYLHDQPGSKAEDSKAVGDSMAQLVKGGAVLMVCRTCGKKGDHWTSKCPFKDLAQPAEGFVDKPPVAEANMPGGAVKGAYVPPNL
ncbi:hypothetical protein H5410_015980 [Solanum commersonii]|uniref:Eukaryotic translation initiation factor 3 subunit G N-terminal domain-containing protein n=1 Tax=Solanum commersonii TaxID=4109 RepID=A0A9J5ZW09_SOLCO|nr:hypothetical protein H5410_015980 [Solanum commersonii]